jgi:CRISPR/Cas system-associated endonuclease Cas1
MLQTRRPERNTGVNTHIWKCIYLEKKTAVTSRLLSYLENRNTDVSDSNHVFVSIFTIFARKIVQSGTYLASYVRDARTKEFSVKAPFIAARN